MAGVAVRTVVDVVPNATVLRVHGRLVVCVAGCARENRKVRWIRMTVVAGRPLSRVRTGIDWKPGVIERRTRPRRCRVALGAIRREACRRVVWIRNILVIRFVAGIAIGRCTRVSPTDMAVCTSYFGVRSSQRKRRLAMVEGRRLPCGRRMANGAVGWESRRKMVWISRAVVVRLVARNATRAEPHVLSTRVATGTGQRNMRAGQWERGLRMIEFRSRPA